MLREGEKAGGRGLGCDRGRSHLLLWVARELEDAGLSTLISLCVWMGVCVCACAVNVCVRVYVCMRVCVCVCLCADVCVCAVSYTHLTLPTNSRV